MLVLLTEPNKVPDVTLAVLHQIGDVRSLEERGIQIPIDLEDEAIQALLSNGPTGYYQSIISIVNSSMWSSDKLSAIKRESSSP